MADKGLIEKTTLQAIADAIREKTGETGLMLPSAMAAAIEAISTGANFSFSITEVVAPGGKSLSGVHHDLGVAPDLILGFTDTPWGIVSSEDVQAFTAGRAYKGSTTWNTMVARYSGSTQNFRGIISGITSVSADETALTLTCTSYFFRAGISYYVIAVAIE